MDCPGDDEVDQLTAKLSLMLAVGCGMFGCVCVCDRELQRVSGEKRLSRDPCGMALARVECALQLAR